jgi:hypothetical protein
MDDIFVVTGHVLGSPSRGQMGVQVSAWCPRMQWKSYTGSMLDFFFQCFVQMASQRQCHSSIGNIWFEMYRSELCVGEYLIYFLAMPNKSFLNQVNFYNIRS